MLQRIIAELLLRQNPLLALIVANRDIYVAIMSRWLFFVEILKKIFFWNQI